MTSLSTKLTRNIFNRCEEIVKKEADSNCCLKIFQTGDGIGCEISSWKEGSIRYLETYKTQEAALYTIQEALSHGYIRVACVQERPGLILKDYFNVEMPALLPKWITNEPKILESQFISARYSLTIPPDCNKILTLSRFLFHALQRHHSWQLECIERDKEEYQLTACNWTNSPHVRVLNSLVDLPADFVDQLKFTKLTVHVSDGTVQYLPELLSDNNLDLLFERLHPTNNRDHGYIFRQLGDRCVAKIVPKDMVESTIYQWDTSNRIEKVALKVLLGMLGPLVGLFYKEKIGWVWGTIRQNVMSADTFLRDQYKVRLLAQRPSELLDLISYRRDKKIWLISSHKEGFGLTWSDKWQNSDFIIKTGQNPFTLLKLMSGRSPVSLQIKHRSEGRVDYYVGGRFLEFGSTMRLDSLDDFLPLCSLYKEKNGNYFRMAYRLKQEGSGILQEVIPPTFKVLLRGPLNREMLLKGLAERPQIVFYDGTRWVAGIQVEDDAVSAPVTCTTAEEYHKLLSSKQIFYAITTEDGLLMQPIDRWIETPITLRFKAHSFEMAKFMAATGPISCVMTQDGQHIIGGRELTPLSENRFHSLQQFLRKSALKSGKSLLHNYAYRLELVSRNSEAEQKSVVDKEGFGELIGDLEMLEEEHKSDLEKSGASNYEVECSLEQLDLFEGMVADLQPTDLSLEKLEDLILDGPILLFHRNKQWWCGNIGVFNRNLLYDPD